MERETLTSGSNASADNLSTAVGASPGGGRVEETSAVGAANSVAAQQKRGHRGIVAGAAPFSPQVSPVGTGQSQKTPPEAFFGSGEWAAGAFPAASAMASSVAVDTRATPCDAEVVAIDFPDSPVSPRLGGVVNGGRDCVGGGNWGGEAVGGPLVEESPSRAREREARKVLMREAGTSGKRVSWKNVTLKTKYSADYIRPSSNSRFACFTAW